MRSVPRTGRILRCAESEETAIKDPNSKDVGAGFRETIAALEKEANTIATALFGTEEFAKTATIVSDIQIRLQNAIESHMARQLSRFNLPSRDDVTALGERLMSMDDRLIRIEEKLRKMSPQQSTPQPGRPPRTKKPGPANTDTVSSPTTKSRSELSKPDQPK